MTVGPVMNAMIRIGTQQRGKSKGSTSKCRRALQGLDRALGAPSRRKPAEETVTLAPRS